MSTVSVESAVHAFLSGEASADMVSAYVAQIPRQYPGWTAQLESDWPVPGDWTLRLASPVGPAREYWLHPEEGQVYLMAAEPQVEPEPAVEESQPWPTLRECLQVLAVADDEWIDEGELMRVCQLALEDVGGQGAERHAQDMCDRVLAAYAHAGHDVGVGRYSIEELLAAVDIVAAG